MNDELQSEALRILKDNIRPRSKESKPEYRHLPKSAVELATNGALRTFVEARCELVKLTPRYRTRHTARTSTEGIGVSYYTVDGRLKEIQTVLLPTRTTQRGCVEAYLRGHDRSPITVHARSNQKYPNPLDPQIIDGRPVYRVIALPSRDLTRELIGAFAKSSLAVD